MKKALFVLAIVFCVPLSSTATTYWISSTGTAANLAACSGETPLSGTACCSYDKANGSGVVAGDTVYYRAGTYSGITGTAIDPYNSGTSLASGRIVFSSYSNETVTFVGSAANCCGIRIDGSKDYLKIHDIDFTDFDYFVVMGGPTASLSDHQCNYNEISYCTFDGMYTNNPVTIPQWAGAYIMHSQYNWVHDCTFAMYGSMYGGNDEGAAFAVGHLNYGDTTGSLYTGYNLIEENTIKWGPHEAIMIAGHYEVVRNNSIINDPRWAYGGETLYNGRSVFASTDTASDDIYLVFENNILAYTGNTPEHVTTYPTCNEGTGSIGFKFGLDDSIIRYNTIYNSNLSGIASEGGDGTNDAGDNVRWYNNTVWNTAKYVYLSVNPSCTPNPALRYAVQVDSTVQGGVFKNNLFEDNYQGSSKTFVLENSSDPTASQITNWATIATDNWLDNNAQDPLLVNADPNAERDEDNPLTQYSFALQATSPCINTGKYLTTATRYDGSATVSVGDARYFFDGWGIDTVWNAYGGNVQPDTVCFTTSSTTVDYANCQKLTSGGADWTNSRITLASNPNLLVGTTYYVWLYKDSDGTQVLHGAAPDYGAYEYVPIGTVTGVTCTSGAKIQ